MGKKRQAQQHIQQSMGQMVSKAALAQLGPHIEQLVSAYVRQLGQNLAQEQTSTLETLFTRMVVLEQLAIEKLGVTGEELVNRVATLEDSKEGYAATEDAQLNDLVRLEISTKMKEQTEYQGSTRLKVYQTGTGQTLGQEIEAAIIGMKAGETKEINFGKDGAMTAKLVVDRVSRSTKPAPAKEAADGDQAQG